MPKTPDLDPWERQPAETEPAFLAFVAYRDMPDRRSLVKVAGALGKSAQLMSGWSARHHWVERAAAWDREQDRVARKATLEAIEGMHRRHANLAVQMLNKAAARLIGDDANNITALDISKLTATELARLAEVGVRIERQARGEPDKLELDLGVGEETQSAVAGLMKTIADMGAKLQVPTFSPLAGGQPAAEPPADQPDQEE